MRRRVGRFVTATGVAELLVDAEYELVFRQASTLATALVLVGSGQHSLFFRARRHLWKTQHDVSRGEWRPDQSAAEKAFDQSSRRCPRDDFSLQVAVLIRDSGMRTS